MGTPLKDWDIQINRGILTGCNEAFIIDSKKRDAIIENCLTDDEKRRTEEIIRPILRGRDIKRYGYEWAELWIIATFPSKKYNIDDYPAVKNYLLSFGKERLEQTGKVHIIDGKTIKSRKKTNNKWFEVQDSIAYWEDFSKPKIIYPETTLDACFAFDEHGYYIDKTCFMLISDEAEYLLHTLSSKLFKFAYKRIFSSVELGENGYQYNKHALIKLPVKKRDATHGLEMQNIDEQIYNIYGISNEEIRVIEGD